MAKTRKDITETPRQRLIRETVYAFYRKYPHLYRDAVKSAKVMKNTRATVWGSDKEKELRMCLRLPKILFKTLDELMIEPGIFNEKEELMWFMREFPEFRTAERV